MPTYVPFSSLTGITLKEILISFGGMCIVYIAEDGTRFVQFHPQDCCEQVSLEDVDGDLTRILNQPIIEASERAEDSEYGSWHFYVIRTNLDSVTMRWYGTSDSRYYAEDAPLFLLGDNETLEDVERYGLHEYLKSL